MTDVIIAGAGPVGLLLGCLLAQRGVEVTVCEQRQGPDQRTRAIGIHPPGLAALDAAGAGDAVRAEALLLEGGEVHARGRPLAAVPFGAARPVHTLAQHRTDAILRARLGALGGALHFGATVTAVRGEAERVRVSIAGAGERSAAFLIAADGVRSGLRAAEGIGWSGHGGRAHYAMVDIPGDADAVARIHCEPGGLVESFPLPGGQRRWVIRLRGRREITADAFAEEIRARTGIRIAMPPGATPATFTAAQHRADGIVRDRVVLLGDAAHEISPIGGQGMNLGWTDAARLAPLLCDALARGDRDLRDHERTTARMAAQAQRRSAFYMSMGAPAPRPAQALREGVIRALGSKALRGRTAALVTMTTR